MGTNMGLVYAQYRYTHGNLRYVQLQVFGMIPHAEGPVGCARYHTDDTEIWQTDPIVRQAGQK